MRYKHITKCYTPEYYQDLILFHLKEVLKSNPIPDVPRILEPSVGDGALIRGVLDKLYSKYDLVALDLEPQFDGALQQDFMDFTLDFETGIKFDICIMNPPFLLIPQKYNESKKKYKVTGKSNMYDLFILHAMRLLKKDGILVALAPTGVARRDVNPVFGKYSCVRIVESNKKFKGIGVSNYSILFFVKQQFDYKVETDGYFDYDKHRVIDNCVIKNDDYELMYQMRYKWLKLKDVCDCNNSNIKPFLKLEV